MHIIPHLMLDGKDVSRYFLSSHSEQTANSSKDPGKYDLVLANIGGKFTGAFKPKSPEEIVSEELGDIAPKKKVSLRMETRKSGCEGDASTIVTIFSGEIQKAEADELFLKIEGSCSEGGMTSRINPRIWPTGTPITTIVNDLLDDFGGIPASKRHIFPLKNSTDDVNPELQDHLDFDTAFYEVSCWAQSIYFFDENDDFWFVPAIDFRGFTHLTGKILRGSTATNLVGYSNRVDVYGGTLEDLSERKTHNLIHAFAQAPDIEIQSKGLQRAPIVVLPNADFAKCQEVANNLLEWYRQYNDVPTIKVVGKAPGLLSKVAYHPWNGNLPPVECDGTEGAKMGAVMGLVTRRIVDISAEAGFVSTLDVTTNFYGAGVPTGDSDAVNFYSQWREAINQDPAIVNKYPGVLLV